MQLLTQAVRRARRRLWMNRWFTHLGWLLLGAAAAFAVVVIVERCWSLAENPERFYAMTGGILALVVLAGSVLWSLLTAESEAVAAARLDGAAKLSERISSGLYCGSMKEPFAQAVVADAEHRCADLDVRRHLPLCWPSSGTYAGISMCVALLVLWLFPELDLAGRLAQAQQQREQQQAVQRAEVRVRPALEEAIDKVTDRLPDIKDETPQLPPASAPAQTPLDVQRQALRQIEQLNDKLEARKQAAQKAGIEDFKKLMRQIQAQSRQSKTPVGELSKALAQGDFKSAQQAIDAMQQQFKNNPATPEEKQKAEELQAQLKELSEKIQQLAENQQQIKDKLTSAGLTAEELKKALEALKNQDMQSLSQQLAAKGLTPQQAQQLTQQLQKMCNGNSSACKLASSLSQAAGAGSQSGDAGQSAAEGLTAAGQQLSEMEATQQELQSLQAAMSDLSQAKDKISGGCSACQGTGQCNGKACSACQGTGQCAGTMASSTGMGTNPNQGEGGIAQKQETDFTLSRERTQVNTVAGSIISQKFIDGEQFKGQVSQDFVQTALSAERRATESIAREQIPRQYHSAIREYFTRSQRGLSNEAGSTTKASP